MKTITIGGVVLGVSLAVACAGNDYVAMPATPSAVMPGPVIISQVDRDGIAFPVYMPNLTLSGVVSEVTPSGLIPLEGVRVYCETCGVETHHSAYTDANGFYSFKGLYYQEFAIWVSKDGYVDPAGMGAQQSLSGGSRLA